MGRGGTGIVRLPPERDSGFVALLGALSLGTSCLAVSMLVMCRPLMSFAPARQQRLVDEQWGAVIDRRSSRSGAIITASSQRLGIQDVHGVLIQSGK